jgi:transcription elongation factor Elf1
MSLPYVIMSTQLLSPAEVGFDPLHSHEKESKEEDKIAKNMEQEIECPRCNDIMTLSSNFDRLFYFCQECDLSLVMTS